MKWDINLDAAEDKECLASGLEAKLYRLVTRVNIACGGHAGDEASMTEAVRLAASTGVIIGAHPSYPDRENFGRRMLPSTPAEIAAFVAEQVGTLKRICDREGQRLQHVKPHGALYNVIAVDLLRAKGFADGVKQVDPSLTLVGFAGSPALELWAKLGFTTLGEAFADRKYLTDGRLAPRDLPGAVISDPEVAAAQAIAFLKSGTAQTICVHGDNPAAEKVLRAYS